MTLRLSTIVLTLLLIAISLLNSCAPNRNEKLDEIEFWHFQSEPNQKRALQEILSEFEKRSNCKVNLTDLSWADGKTKLFAAFYSKTEPDVIELGSDWVAQFSSAGVLSELNSRTIDFNKFVDFTQEPCLYHNKIYALPWYVDTRVIFYNKKLLQESEVDIQSIQTFDDWLAATKKIQDHYYGQNKYGIAVNGPDSHRLYKKIASYLWSYGGDILNRKKQFVLNSQNNILAVEKYAEGLQYGIMGTQRSLDESFVQGNIGFIISGAWLLQKIQNENPTLEYGVMTLPRTNFGEGISFAGGEYLAVTELGGKKPLATKLIEFLSDGKNSIQYCKKVPEAGFPADKNYFQDEFYKSQKVRSTIAEQLKKSRMTPVHKDWLDIEEALEKAVEKVMYKKQSAKQALDELQQYCIEKFSY